MALGSHIWQSLCVNFLANPTEQYEIAGAQPLIKRYNVRGNKASTKAPIPHKAPTLSLALFPTKDRFIKFMMVFMETTQAQARDKEQLEPQKRQLKTKTLETYFRKSHKDYYYFCH